MKSLRYKRAHSKRRSKLGKTRRKHVEIALGEVVEV